MVGLGIDIVRVDRIAALIHRHGDRFRHRCFQPAEMAMASRRGPLEAATLAARWAAKEAFLKALGPAAHGIIWRDIEVYGGEAGQPLLRLHSSAASALSAAGGSTAHVSLSHERDHAVAVVLIE